MGCNCKNGFAPASKFGTCSLCMYLTLSGFICSWLLWLPFLFIETSPALTAAMGLPAAFFTVWLALHLAAYRRRNRGRKGPLPRPR